MRWLDADFSGSLEHVWNLVETGQPVAVSRFGDGETSLMKGGKIMGQALRVDGWSHSGGDSLLGRELNAVAENPGLIQGISCRCCQPRYHDYLAVRCKGLLTFANLFINGNHSSFLKHLVAFTRPVFLIASDKMVANVSLPFSINGAFTVPGDCVQFFEQNRERLYQNMKLISSVWRHSLILVAAGPLATVFVHWLQTFNPQIQALDIGSAIDQHLFGKDTRPFQIPGHPLNSKMCIR